MLSLSLYTIVIIIKGCIVMSVGVRYDFLFFIAEFKSPSHAVVSAVEWNP